MGVREEKTYINSNRDLNVWKNGIEIVKSVYIISAGFPKEEIYGLSSQIRRSAISIPSNIAGGHGRDSLKEYLRFISIALGSIAELQTQIFIAKELKFIDEVKYNELTDLSEVTGRMLKKLQQTLKSRIPLSPIT